MLKRSMLVLCMVVFLAMGACGSPQGKNSGLLTDEEIGKYESLYFMDDETMLEGLGVSEKDVDRESKYGELLLQRGSYLLKEPRDIAGADFQVILNTSVYTEHKGLYGIWLRAFFEDKEQAREVLAAVYDEALERYGEDERGYDMTRDDFLGQLDRSPDQGFLKWGVGVGEVSAMWLSTSMPLSDGESYSIEIQYQVDTRVDVHGRELEPDELLDRVRSVQQK